MKQENPRHWLVLCASLVLASVPLDVMAGPIAGPDAMIGHAVGQDYKLARYEKVAAYFRYVAHASARVNVRTIGTTTEGRNMILAEITDEATPEQLRLAMADQNAHG